MDIRLHWLPVALDSDLEDEVENQLCTRMKRVSMKKIMRRWIYNEFYLAETAFFSYCRLLGVQQCIVVAIWLVKWQGVEGTRYNRVFKGKMYPRVRSGSKDPSCFKIKYGACLLITVSHRRGLIACIVTASRSVPPEEFCLGTLLSLRTGRLNTISTFWFFQGTQSWTNGSLGVERAIWKAEQSPMSWMTVLDAIILRYVRGWLVLKKWKKS